jgi:hypothetical protein
LAILELQHEIRGPLVEPDLDHPASLQQRASLGVSIHRSRQTELLAMVARCQRNLAVSDDAPEAVNRENGLTDSKVKFPRVVLVHAGTNLPIQTLDALIRR